MSVETVTITTKPMAYRQNVLLENAVLRDFILDQLHWSEVQYFSYMQEIALIWLEAKYGEDTEMYDLMNNGQAFWGWWKTIWANKEAEFLADNPKIQYYYQKRTAYWLQQILDNGMFPNSAVVELCVFEQKTKRALQSLLIQTKDADRLVELISNTLELAKSKGLKIENFPSKYVKYYRSPRVETRGNSGVNSKEVPRG